MNILKFELKRNIKVTYVWIISVMICAILFLAMAPIFMEESDVLKEYLDAMGPEFLLGMGINVDYFFSPVGFYGYVGGYIALALGIQGIVYGMKAFLTEKNQKSNDFLYTKPVKRSKIFAQKVVANAILLFITQIIIIATILIAQDTFNSVNYDHIIMFKMVATIIPIQFLFYGLGVLISVSLSKFKNIVSVALVAGFGMYFFNILGAIFDRAVFDYLSFFNYFNLNDIMTTGGYETKFVLLTIGVLVVLFGGSYLIINKRDLRAA